jgi:CubicO group peptidase (beta-lactamase class C family)
MQNKIDFSHEVRPVEAGFSQDGFDRLSRLFEDQVNVQNLHPSAQMVILRHGKVVMDRAIGNDRGQPISRETPYLTFSVSKAFTGACVHQLIEQGKIELDAKVADYWPEYGCKGKEETTIRQVFLHQGGIPAPHLNTQAMVWWNWQLGTRHVAQTRSVFPPGEKTAYHMLNYGFILGEVVRRVTGRMVGEYLDEQFLRPLGMSSSWMPIPRKELFRSPKLVTPDRSLKLAVVLFNLPFNRCALMPAATLHSSARNLAVFYQMLLNGGEYDGKRYLKPETIEFATSPGYEGIDHAFNSYSRWGYGFHLGGKIMTPEGEEQMGMGKGSSQRAFGHFGMDSSLAFADPEADLVVAFTTNGMIKASDARVRALLDTMWDAVEK